MWNHHQLLLFTVTLLAFIGCNRKNDPTPTLNPKAPQSTSSASLGWPSIDLPPESPVCQIALPKDFKGETLNQPSAQVQVQVFYHEAESFSAYLSVMQNSLRNWTPSEQDRLLQGARDGAIGMIGGKIVQQDAVSVGRGRGFDCDVRCTAEGKDMRILMRLVAAEPYVFAAQWGQESKDFDAGLAKEFVDSFKLLPAPAGKPDDPDQPAATPQSPR